MQTISVGDLTSGKKVILFAVPGAFTPTCSLKHLPGFIEKADELKAKGVDTIGCVATNDAFVMSACTLLAVVNLRDTPPHYSCTQGASPWVPMTRCSCWQTAAASLPRLVF